MDEMVKVWHEGMDESEAKTMFLLSSDTTFAVVEDYAEAHLTQGTHRVYARMLDGTIETFDVRVRVVAEADATHTCTPPYVVALAMQHIAPVGGNRPGHSKENGISRQVSRQDRKRVGPDVENRPGERDG